MPRPVTLFTGQWADLPLENSLRSPSDMGYDGLELACWGDHFDVDRGDRAAGLRGRAAAALLRRSTGCSATRSRPTSSARRCATSSTSGTSRSCPPTSGATAIPRASASAPRSEVDTAAARARRRRVRRRRRQRLHRLEHLALASTRSRRPSQEYWDAGFRDFAKRWTPILDDVRRSTTCDFALEVHPTEIAFDIASAERALEAIEGHKQFGFNYDPSPPRLPGRRLREVHPRVRRPHLPRPHEGRRGGATATARSACSAATRASATPRRYWDFRSRRPRRRRLRGHHRRAQRRRLRGPAERRVGRRAHGPRARRHRGGGVRASGSTSRRRTSRSTPPSTGTSSHEPAALRHGRRRPQRVHRRRAPRRAARSTSRPCWPPARSRRIRRGPASRRATSASPTTAAYGSWQEMLDGELARPGGRPHRLRRRS